MGIRDLVFMQAPAQTTFDTNRFDGVTGWLATGFTLLGGILTFFGIKEGVLDRLLRTDPTAALLVFCFVGLGVVLGVMTALIGVNVYLRMGLVIGTVLALTLLAMQIYPDIGQSQDASTAAIVAVLLIAGVALAAMQLSIHAVVGALIVAVASTSLGLYGAAKLSVLSKTTSVGSQVSAKLVEGDAGDVVQVTVSAFGLDKGTMTVQVLGAAAPLDETTAGEVVIGARNLRTGNAGDISETIDFPVDATRWGYLVVRAMENEGEPTDDLAKPAVEAPRVAILQGQLPVARVSGTLKLVEKGASVEGSVVGAGVSPQTRLRVAIVQAGTATTRTASATLTPDDAGAITWTAQVPVRGGKALGRLQLRIRTCTAVEGNEAPQCSASRTVAQLHRRLVTVSAP